MFNLQDAKSYHKVTLEEIYSKVNDLDLWKYYCSNFKKLDTSFKSELYNDKNPSCRIKYGKSGRLYYRDYGSGEYYSTIISYIKAKYNCNFQEALNIISNDFNIRKINYSVNKSSKRIEEVLLTRPKTDIQVLEQPFNLIDKHYWMQYGITLEQLSKEEVFATKYVYIDSIKGCFKTEYSFVNPIYVYKEYDINLNYVGSRIYMPLSDDKRRKWLNNSPNHLVIQGIRNLSSEGDLLIITKSLKDVLVLRNLGYQAISLGSETMPISEDLYKDLNKRFKRIITLYDNDVQGIKSSSQIEKKWGFKAFYVPKEEDVKDISDFIKKYGLNKSIELMKDLINGKNNNQY